jgi:aryl sulfotransferase
MKKIIWLASYPKSGNTWVRAFLSYLFRDNTDDNFIRKLTAPSVSTRRFYDDYLDIETSDIPYGELERLRPVAIRAMAAELDEVPYFMKVHDAYTYTADNEPLFPADVSIGVIYLIRNPIDIAPSFSHHLDDTVDNVIRLMLSEDAALANNTKGILLHIKQKLTSWSSHVKGWTEQQDIPVLVIRYEDMLREPLIQFKKMAAFSGLSFSDDEIAAAVEKCSFKNLQRLEQEFGFSEKMSQVNPFFRSGKSGSGKEELTTAQLDLLYDGLGAVMETFGYTAA